MLWKMRCFALQSMGRTNHKFPVYVTRNVQTQLKLTVHMYGSRSPLIVSGGREGRGSRITEKEYDMAHNRYLLWAVMEAPFPWGGGGGGGREEAIKP